MGGTTARGGCMLLVALAWLLAFNSSAVAKPQPGDPDRSFSGDGAALTSVPPGSSYGQAVAIGRKRRIVVAGYNRKGFALARYKPDGHLDRSLSENGRLSTGFGDDYVVGNDVAIGHKGSIVVAGRACLPCRFAVARYQPDGKLDKSFGNGGKVKVAFPGNAYSSASAVAIDSRGRVLLGGTACPKQATSGCKFALARLDRTGRLDPTFGSDGRVITRFTDNAGDQAYSAATDMAIDSRGRIVLGGTAEGIALACYKPNGRLVRSFGHDGKVDKVLRHHFFGNVSSIALDAKNRIVAAGSIYSLARFGKDGRLDHSFGKRGQVSTTVGNGDAPLRAMAIDSRNRIVVAGAPRFTLIRYRPNGKVNRAFGVHGKVKEDLGRGQPFGVAIDSHDRPVAAGFTKERSSLARIFAVARFLG